VWVCGHSLGGIVGSNPAGDMDVCLLWVLCVVRSRSLRRAGHSSRGVLPSVVYLNRESSTMRRPWPTRGCCAMGGGEVRRYNRLNILLSTRLIAWITYKERKPTGRNCIAYRSSEASIKIRDQNWSTLYPTRLYMIHDPCIFRIYKIMVQTNGQKYVGIFVTIILYPRGLF
jgi:hypothetical protein